MCLKASSGCSLPKSILARAFLLKFRKFCYQLFCISGKQHIQ